MYHHTTAAAALGQPQYVQIYRRNSTLFRTLRVMVYITTVVSILFLIMDFVVIATSYDPSFVFPFILAVAFFSVRLVNMIGLYFVLNRVYQTAANVMLSAGFVVISLALLIVSAEIIAFSKSISYMASNPFFLYFSLLVTTDLLALVQNNYALPSPFRSREVTDPRTVSISFSNKPEDEGVVYNITEMCQFSYVAR